MLIITKASGATLETASPTPNRLASPGGGRKPNFPPPPHAPNSFKTIRLSCCDNSAFQVLFIIFLPFRGTCQLWCISLANSIQMFLQLPGKASIYPTVNYFLQKS